MVFACIGRWHSLTALAITTLLPSPISPLPTITHHYPSLSTYPPPPTTGRVLPRHKSNDSRLVLTVFWKINNAQKNLKMKETGETDSEAGSRVPQQPQKRLSKFAMIKKMKYEDKKYQTPIQTREYGVTPPPPVVVVFGPKLSGKSLLLSSLVRHYTRQRIEEIKGTVTMMVSKTRRITLYECAANLPAMVDASKIADLVVFTVDASVGLEIETFEMLNLLKTHGFPKIICVVTKLDTIQSASQRRSLVKKIKKRMWAEVCDGIKVFAMTKTIGGRYLDREVDSVARVVTQMKYRPIQWRSTHPYIVADQVLFQKSEAGKNAPDGGERTEEEEGGEKAEGFTITGYVRGGIAVKKQATFHIPGVGDYAAERIEVVEDPCPLFSSQKKRLSERKKPLFAPCSRVRGMLVHQDEVYLDIEKRENTHEEEHSVAAWENEGGNEKGFSLFEDPEQRLDLHGDGCSEDGTSADGQSEELSTAEGEDSSGTGKEDAEQDERSESTYDGSSGVEMAGRRDRGRTEVGHDDASGEGVSDDASDDASDDDVSDAREGLTEMAVRSMFRKKEETEEDYAEKFEQEYDEKEKDKRDIFAQEKSKYGEMERINEEIVQNHAADKRMHIEGIPPGRYVKIHIRLPKKVKNICDPEHLIVLGANREEELSMTFVQGRAKRHRWFKKTLKTREAHYVSMGWRRFQTVPTFSMKDSTRNRYLKYTPDSMACSVTFYGPVHAPGTAFCLLRKLGEEKNFRIAANGTETEIGDHPSIMKKLKLVGYPEQIKGHTVFVKDMFHTPEEASRYEGAIVKTVSGLRGQIKKAGAKGVFRATFEGSPKMSDIVFLPCFFPITPMKAYLNAESFENAGEIRLLKEIREERGLSVQERANSTYRAVRRPEGVRERPLPRRIAAKAPLAMLEKEEEPEREQAGSSETLAKVKALEAIARKAEQIREEKAKKREKRIAEIVQERKEIRKKREDKMKDEARVAENRKHKKKGKGSKKHKKTKAKPIKAK